MGCRSHAHNRDFRKLLAIETSDSGCPALSRLLDTPVRLRDYPVQIWGPAMDVGEWLRSLGLDEYEDRFRDSKIDVDVLADLTDGDLEKLGLPLGDRKRLLRAIATLAPREQAPTEARLATAPPASPPKSSTRADSAERRPITVMFCDLVGSTGLAARLDAEDWRNLVGVLPRRSLGGGDGARRPCAKEARRRADGAVRLSAGAGE